MSLKIFDVQIQIIIKFGTAKSINAENSPAGPHYSNFEPEYVIKGFTAPNVKKLFKWMPTLCNEDAIYLLNKVWPKRTLKVT